MSLSPAELAERAAAIETLLAVRMYGTARLLRENLANVSLPDGYGGDRLMCEEHLGLSVGLATPDQMARHLLLDHSEEAAGVELCDACEGGFGTEVRTAFVEVVGGPLVGRRIVDGEPVLITGAFRLDPFARLCTDCGRLWEEDESYPVVIKV